MQALARLVLLPDGGVRCADGDPCFCRRHTRQWAMVSTGSTIGELRVGGNMQRIWSKSASYVSVRLVSVCISCVCTPCWQDL